LTQRYGSQGFLRGAQGLFYYYFVTAKTMSVFRQRSLTTPDGVAHDWSREIASRLLAAQRPDGSWSNSESGWWESEPVLATAYALLTLELCRAGLAQQ
jgi:squalene-hopene/tetraprenyl-beta-curcumene cyclase